MSVQAAWLVACFRAAHSFCADAKDLFHGVHPEPSLGVAEGGEGPCPARRSEVVDGDDRVLVELLGKGVDDDSLERLLIAEPLDHNESYGNS